MPDSRFGLHGLAPPLVDGLCAVFVSNSRFMRLVEAPLDSECAKGAAKASCGETVVRKGVFGESVSSLPP